EVRKGLPPQRFVLTRVDAAKIVAVVTVSERTSKGLQPIKDASVALHKPGDKTAITSGLTDAEGKVRLQAAAEGKYEIIAKKAEHRPAQKTVELQAGSHAVELILERLPGAITVPGSVVPAGAKPGTFQGVPDAELVWTAAGAAKPAQIVRSDKSGAFTLKLAEGKY